MTFCGICGIKIFEMHLTILIKDFFHPDIEFIRNFNTSDVDINDKETIEVSPFSKKSAYVTDSINNSFFFSGCWTRPQI